MEKGPEKRGDGNEGILQEGKDVGQASKESAAEHDEEIVTEMLAAILDGVRAIRFAAFAILGLLLGAILL